MTTEKSSGCLLAGDIGGTKTSLALFGPDKGNLLPLAEKTVNNDTASGLEEIIASFLGEQTVRPGSACFGVAGPVINNRAHMTNLPWTVDARGLRQRFGMRSVILINDLVATAMGAVSLPAGQLHTLNRGRPDHGGAVAVIAPGTGLGQAFLVRYRGRFLPFPSEGGHCAFAPASEQQARLLAFMSRRLDHVSAEQVCSGIGIPSLYDFLRADRPGRVATRGTAGNGDRTRAIVEAALAAGKEGDDPLAAEALALFVAILATESANLVLKILATGGLYIGGGLPPRILPYLTAKAFLGDFCRGRHRQMLARVPVHVILEPRTALIGAAAYACAFDSGARDRP